ncbi:MAG: FAD-dependent oxidoreductase, partial [Robiginitalea sp.]
LFKGQVVQRIEKTEHGIRVITQQQEFQANLVISTLPPYLLKDQIEITPSLSPNLERLLEQTHTWMGESIKIGMAYKEPFWRNPNTSGTVFSNVGPISELYDHSNYADTRFALKGFFNPSYFSLTRGQRLEMLLNQLRKYFGTLADSYASYHETIWADEKYTFAPYTTHMLPHQNNGHELYQKPCFNGRFFIAGSETSSDYPGYMEGAVRSAEFMQALLLQRI